MLRLIVVPLDGSPLGEQALPLAVRLAERERAELVLVHVHEYIPPYMTQGAPPLDPSLDVELRRDRQAYLDAMADRLRRTTSATVRATLLTSPDVVDALNEYVAAQHADLVVMATHGRGGLSRLWIGSVAHELVRRSDVPVLLVRPTEAGSREAPAAPFRLALVPLDGTPADDEAIDDALLVAGDPGVEVVLLHVVVPVVYLGDPPATELVLETQIEAAMQQYLDEVAGRIRARGFVVATEVIPDVSPARAILDLAQERAADLIVMETHARAGVSRLVLGSVTDKVIRAARAPVLVHRRRVESERAHTAAGQSAAQVRH